MQKAGDITLRICYVQAYRAPDYIRGISLCRALSDSAEVEVVMATNSSRGIGRYLQALRGLLRARASRPHIYILGFRGHEIAPFIRHLVGGTPLVFDAMMSPYAAMHEENKLGRLGRAIAPLWKLYEGHILRDADLVLTDTRLHANYYRDTFGLSSDKLLPLPVGAIEHSPPPSQPITGQSVFRVLFYGSFLPLHGMDVIRRSAALLSDLPIHFDFVGGTAEQARRLAATFTTHGAFRYSHRAWVPINQLLAEDIPAADLCLGGPFGGTPQARRVLTGKSSQCLALGKATVIGRIDEELGLVDRHNCLLVEQDDPASLAAAIRWAYEHPKDLSSIGLRGQMLYHERLSTKTIAAHLVPALRALVHGQA